jgi:predicted fused transcriptional regulator/phosphomethylpyrimidine kinase
MLGEDGTKWLDRLQMQVARSLQAQGWSQQNISGMIGMTQSTISRQRGRPLPPLKGSADESVVDGWATEMTQLLSNLGPDAKLKQQRYVIEFLFDDGRNIRFDKILTGTDLDRGQTRAGLIRRLEWITQRFIIPKIERWQPAIGMNVAACTADAIDIEDVAAFPGRLWIINDQIKYMSMPEFGASKHLAGVLLKARSFGSKATAILNLAFPEKSIKKINSAAKKLNLIVSLAPRSIPIDSCEDAHILVDEGDFGWVPTLYVLGSNPIELIDRAHLLIDTLEG